MTFIGIVFGDGESWKEHRRYVLQVFRDFGVGKFKMEDKIVDEAQALIEFLAAKGGQPLETKLPISTAVANVINSVLTGIRYESDDPEFVKFISLAKENLSVTMGKGLLAVMPWLRFFPPLRTVHRELVDNILGLRSFFLKITNERLKNWIPDRNSDFLDSYISAVKSGRHETFGGKFAIIDLVFSKFKQHSLFTARQIPPLLDDLFEAGYETTTTILRWV